MAKLNRKSFFKGLAIGTISMPFAIRALMGDLKAQSKSAGNLASGYWAGKIPAAQFFASVPFGLNAQQMNAWLLNGGGLELWEELYSTHNLLPLPAGNTGVQMGGWFNREINSLADFKGLKMRMPGLGGKVLEKAGGTPVKWVFTKSLNTTTRRAGMRQALL